MFASASPLNSLFTDLQSLLQPQETPTGTGTQSGATPQFLVFGAFLPDASPTTSPSGSASTDLSDTAAAAVSGASTSSVLPQQFGPQTFAALVAIQEDLANLQSSLANFAAAGTGGVGGPTWGQQQSDNWGWVGSNGQNYLNAADSGASGGSPSSLGLSNMDSGATAQTITNANGSTSTTITYADGSTVTMTIPAATNVTSSSDTSGSSTGDSGSNNGSTTTGTAETTGDSASQSATPGLEQLIAAQANALSAQALLSELAGGGATQTSAPGLQGQDQNNLYAGGLNGTGGLGIGSAQNLLAMLTSGDSGATSQATDNPNGSTTTTITYANGSTVTLTTAAPSASATGSDSSVGTDDSSLATDPASANASLTSYNLIEQMIQLQAQLLNPTTQSMSA